MIPKQQEPIVDRNGHATPNWYRYLRGMAAQVVTDAIAPTFQALWGEIIGRGFLIRNSIGEPLFRKIAGTAGNIIVTNDDGTTGDPTIDLAEVTDAGGGTLQKTDVDDYGRVIGTSAATTDDLPEGSNLYYTDTRADARVDAGIAAHEAELDPHPQYATDTDLAAKANVNAPAFTGLVNAVDDTAAASGGVAIGSMYRNGSILMIRVT